MIDFNDYTSEIKALQEGDQTHVNHLHCSAGQDTKKRLYLKRIEDGKVLGYCHHCGAKGILKGKRVLKSLAALKEPFEKEIEKGAIVPQLTYGNDSLQSSPNYFKAWLTRMNFYEDNVLRRTYLRDKIGYHDPSHRIYVPYYWDTKVAGYQSRVIAPRVEDPSTPKWLTVRLDSTAPAQCSVLDIDPPADLDPTPVEKRINLVLEDLVSFHVVWQWIVQEYRDSMNAEHSIRIWCTMGTTMPPIMRAKISDDIAHKRCTAPLVWFDADVAGTVGRNKILKDLGVTGHQVTLSFMRDEPKNLGHYELSVALQTLIDMQFNT